MHRPQYPLMIIVAVLWSAFRRYGIAFLATGVRMRHAALGRAKRSLSYVGNHTTRIVGNNCMATDLVRQLREERARALVTYGATA